MQSTRGSTDDQPWLTRRPEWRGGHGQSSFELSLLCNALLSITLHPHEAPLKADIPPRRPGPRANAQKLRLDLRVGRAQGTLVSGRTPGYVLKGEVEEGMEVFAMVLSSHDSALDWA